MRQHHVRSGLGQPVAREGPTAQVRGKTAPRFSPKLQSSLRAVHFADSIGGVGGSRRPTRLTDHGEEPQRPPPQGGAPAKAGSPSRQPRTIRQQTPRWHSALAIRPRPARPTPATPSRPRCRSTEAVKNLLRHEGATPSRRKSRSRLETQKGMKSSRHLWSPRCRLMQHP